MHASGKATGGAPTRQWLAAALTIAAALTGCGGTTQAPALPSVASTAAVTPSGQATPSAADDANVSAIKASYLRFFSPKTPLGVAMTLLQNGPAFRSTLAAQAKTEFARATTATVTTVTLNSSDRATVVFSILLSGKPVLVNSVGSAVREAGAWKVAGVTFCGLLSAQGPPPTVCAQAASK